MILNPYIYNALLLDIYPNAAFAYSFYKLNTDYTGYCIRIRRTSDNTDLDIGFSGNIIDVSAIATFCSGTGGIVIIWYDQSGNSNDISGASAPLLYTTGAMITANSKYTAQFNGASHELVKNPYTGLDLKNCSVYVIGSNASTSGTQQMVGLGGATGNNRFYIGVLASTTNYFGYGALGTAITAKSPANTSLTLYSMFSDATTVEGFTNGVSKGTTSSSTLNSQWISIGNIPGSSVWLNGYISTVIGYPATNSENRIGIENYLNNFYSIY